VAVSVGWPNDTETLEKLGRLIWKETRCLNIGYQHPSFNGSDHGLIQANEIHTRWAEELFNMPFEESMSDPTLNLRFGFLLYDATAFPSNAKESAESRAIIKPICEACPVFDKCFAYAVSFPEKALQGFWANTSEGDRRRMRYSATPIGYRRNIPTT